MAAMAGVTMLRLLPASHPRLWGSGAKVAVARGRAGWGELAANSGLLRAPVGAQQRWQPVQVGQVRTLATTAPLLNTSVRPESGKVRLIDQQGVNRGILPLAAALEIAQKAKLDLLQVTPTPQGDKARDFVPVCKVVNYSKLRYDAKRKDNERKAAAKVSDRSGVVKEIKIGTSIGDKDLELKIKKMLQFLEKRNSVRVTIVFRRSLQIAPRDREARAFEILQHFESKTAGVGRELHDQRKIMVGSVRSVFIPAPVKGHPGAPNA